MSMPPSVAIIGASADRAKFGNKSVRAHQKRGYQVFPVHPTAKMIEGLRTYSSVRDLPVTGLDRISIYLPPAITITILNDIAANPAKEVWFNPGADDPSVIAKAKALGINAIAGCSIVSIGESPTDY